MLISKNKFIEIINRLKNYNELQEKIDNLFKDLIDNEEQDFMNAGSICIGHETIVIQILETMFETDIISWWIYETEYGTSFKMGSFIDNGQNVDLSTPEKLYEYLIKEINRKKE